MSFQAHFRIVITRKTSFIYERRKKIKHHGISRQRIYQVASSLISQKGFHDTSISEICRDAGCSVGAFYHHFSSKDSILEETFRLADLDFEVWDFPDQEASDGKELVYRYMTCYVELIEDTGLNFIKRFYNNDNKTFIKEGRSMQPRLVEIIESFSQRGLLTIHDTPRDVCEKFLLLPGELYFTGVFMKAVLI